jgi:hypothetical protein
MRGTSWSSNGSNYRSSFDWFRFLVISIIAVVAIGVVSSFFITIFGRFTGIHWQYSEGERVGTVYKLSKKGWIWQTNEGELNLGGVSAGEGGIMVPNAWAFSVRPADEAKVLPVIQEAMKSGHRITVTYTQYALSPISWGDTQYYITNVTDSTPITPERKK